MTEELDGHAYYSCACSSIVYLVLQASVSWVLEGTVESYKRYVWSGCVIRHCNPVIILVIEYPRLRVDQLSWCARL